MSQQRSCQTLRVTYNRKRAPKIQPFKLMIRWQTQGDPDLFLKYNYAETKDLCKQFLALVTSVLVFSLAFAEKISGLQSHTTKWLLCAAWFAMLTAITLCGIGLTLITLAAGNAVYEKRNYLEIAARSYNCIVVAGACFVVSLLLLMITAIVRLPST
jgi:hypothetical protein